MLQHVLGRDHPIFGQVNGEKLAWESLDSLFESKEGCPMTFITQNKVFLRIDLSTFIAAY